MVDLNLKDRKILYQLDLNCRQSNTQIGKKVGLSRQVVEYRIKKMEDEGIITGYWANIDSYRFGYQVYRYYLVLQNVTLNKKEEIIKNISDYKNTWVLASLNGIYDLTCILWVKRIPQFYKFWDNINEEYGDYFAEKIFSIYLESDRYPRRFLILNESSDTDLAYIEHNGTNDPIEISYNDYRLLDAISKDARIPTIKLSEILNCSSQKIQYNINKLKEKGIIQGFHTGLNLSKLGVKQFKVDIWLKETSKRRKIWEFIKSNPKVGFINTSAGYCDLGIEFTVKNSDIIIDIMENMIAKFPSAIRKYIYWSVKEYHKLRCLPEMTEKDFKKP